jgi:hypothetical protein
MCLSNDQAFDAFSPPRRLFVPGVSAPISGFTVYNPGTGDLSTFGQGNDGLGRRVQSTPYSDNVK